jgi:uncharacterized protein YbjT (DUF2867 family)
MLVYGATAKAGRLVKARAHERGWAVVAFVRNLRRDGAASAVVPNSHMLSPTIGRLG